MSKLRTALAAVTFACVLMLAGAGTASAQDRVPFTKKLAITGTNKGKDFKGTYTIKRFKKSGDKLVAVGTLKGTLKHRTLTRRNGPTPATLTQAPQTSQLPPNPTPGACQILDLVLNPI